MKLLKRLGFNKKTIDVERDKQPFYWPIYSLELVELKTIKVILRLI